MTTIYDYKTKQVYDLSIVVDGIHQEDGILGNMGICALGTGIYRVRDFDPDRPTAYLEEWETEPTPGEVEARRMDCEFYGDTEAVAWWVRYVDDYCRRLELEEEFQEFLSDADEAALEAACNGLGIDPGWGMQEAITAWIYEQCGGEYEDEHSQFVGCLQAFREALPEDEREGFPGLE